MDFIRLYHPSRKVPPGVVRARARLGKHLGKPVTSIALRKWASRPSSRKLTNQFAHSLQLASKTKTLSLDGCRVGRITGSNLVTLVLHNSEVTEPLSLKDYPKLRALRMRGQSKITGLANLPNLERLTILNVTGLPRLTNLTAVHLSCDGKVKLQALCHCTVLKKATLHIKETVQLNHVRLFATQPNLKELLFLGKFSDEAFAGLCELDQGKEMRISQLGIWDTGKALKPAPVDMRLDKLVLFTGSWSQSWIEALAKSKKLKESLQSIILELTDCDHKVLLTFKKLRFIEHSDDRREAVKLFLPPPME